MDQPFIGSIVLFGGNFAPRNWAFCDGSLQSIQQNSALFAILGTTYGGDGRTTFALPDLRGRAPIHAAQGPGLPPYTLGEMGGSPTQTLNIQQMPPHTHAVKVPTTDGGGNSASPNDKINAEQGGNFYADLVNADGSYGGVTASVTGGGQPVSIMQPYLAINYIIALYGTFPSRN